MSTTRQIQTGTIISISNPSSLITITSFESNPLWLYFFNPTTNDILLYLPISNQYKLLKSTHHNVKGHTYDVIALIHSNNSKRILLRYCYNLINFLRIISFFLNNIVSSTL